jgi:alginate O-acetyltransferase complex protein AlgI
MTQLPAWFGTVLWLAGWGHFLVLCASFQVPYQLKWRQDLAKLMPLNRKLMWVYGVYIVLLISSFGVLTLSLHDELLRGDRAALGLATLIGLFWLTRIGIDCFYFRHADWPSGTYFAVGHFLLTTLFIALASTYLGLVAWHVWGG